MLKVGRYQPQKIQSSHLKTTHICLALTRDILIDTFIFLLLLMSELVFFTAPLLVCEMSSL